MEIHPSRHFLTALGLFLITVGLCGVFAGGHVYVRDGAAMYMMSASIVDHHWFDVDSSHPNTVGGRFGPDGKYYMLFGYLQPLLATPFFMVGRKLAETFQTDYISFFAVTVFNWCVTGMLACHVYGVSENGCCTAKSSRRRTRLGVRNSLLGVFPDVLLRTADGSAGCAGLAQHDPV